MHAPLTDSHDNAMTDDPWSSHASHPRGAVRAASCYESSGSSRWNAIAGRYDNQATEPLVPAEYGDGAPASRAAFSPTSFHFCAGTPPDKLEYARRQTKCRAWAQSSGGSIIQDDTDRRDHHEYKRLFMPARQQQQRDVAIHDMPGTGLAIQAAPRIGTAAATAGVKDFTPASK